ncbi:methyltransferase domain-containing protein [Paramicrobacterium agarici]|uniref:methyltransferase domain-containing protein n=1 Tax=Paramicrobacterium agarici TaxID=630514 RepID=UPI001474E044
MFPHHERGSVHARALQGRGLAVELVDPVAAQVGDARDLPFADNEFDAALLLGPLYHLAGARERLTALTEAARVTRPGGVVFAAALSRTVAFQAATLGRKPCMTPELAQFFEAALRFQAVDFPPVTFIRLTSWRPRSSRSASS